MYLDDQEELRGDVDKRDAPCEQMHVGVMHVCHSPLDITSCNIINQWGAVD